MSTTARTQRWLVFPILALILTGCFQEANSSIQPTPVSVTEMPAFQDTFPTPTPFVTPLSEGGFPVPSDDPNFFLTTAPFDFATPTPFEEFIETSIPFETPTETIIDDTAFTSFEETPTLDMFAPPPTIEESFSGAEGADDLSQPIDDPAENPVFFETPTEIPTEIPTLMETPTPLATNPPCQHVVLPGEWFYSIARKYNLNPEDLIAANPRTDPDSLDPGDVLQIPNCTPEPTVPSITATPTPPSLLPMATSPQSPTPLGPATDIPTPIPLSGRTYTVVEGDTLGAIARKFGITVQMLRDANGLRNEDILSIGMVLKIPKAN